MTSELERAFNDAFVARSSHDDHTHYPNSASSFNGWTCSLCGNWVPNGCTHSCPTNAWPQPQPQTQVRVDHGFALLALGNRIADLLERLVIALERKENP